MIVYSRVDVVFINNQKQIRSLETDLYHFYIIFMCFTLVLI